MRPKRKRRTRSFEMEIVEFCEHPDLIDDQGLSVAQRVVLKSVYGDSLLPDEMRMFTELTGLEKYPYQEFNEASIIAGRSSGKSSKLAANIAIYEALGRKHKLARGEVGVVSIVATEMRRQARICYDYVLGKLEASRILSAEIKKVTSTYVL